MANHLCSCSGTRCRVTIKNAMRLLHITKYAHPAKGGMETFVRDLTAEQTRCGHAVAVLCHQTGSLRRTESTRVDEITTIRCATLLATPFAPLSPVFPLRLKDALRQERPDVIHLHLPNPAVLFQKLLPRDIPLVVHWHADVQESASTVIRALYPAYRIFEQLCLARADRIVATSTPYLESSPSLAPWRDKCTVVPLGLDTGRYPEESTARPQKPMVLGVGRMAFYKGFEHLVRAAALVREATFVIVGDGPKRHGIEDEIRCLGLEERVLLPGRVSDAELRRYLQAASVFCLPSMDRGEAFGVSVLEAMRYGLPLVTTAIPGSGTGWVNQNRETGLVVPPADSEKLAQAIRHILDDPTQTEQYGLASRKRLEDKFTIARTARSIDQIYADISRS